MRAAFLISAFLLFFPFATLACSYEPETASKACPSGSFNSITCACDPVPAVNENSCNGMNATNTSCAMGTEWDDATCSCKNVCEDGFIFNTETNNCTPNT